LKRELTANPKKAAALGALFIVAIWFWAPLLKDWIAPAVKVPAAPPGNAAGTPANPNSPTQPGTTSPGSFAANSQTPAVQPAGTNPAVAPGAAGAEQPQPFAGGYTWQQIAEAIDTDARMKPAVLVTNRTDVFPAAPPPQASTESIAEQPSAKLSPSEAGLVLSSTIVGPSRRMALINGRRYGVGDEIKSTKEGQQIVFKLLSVEPRQIVLENDGDRFLVKMPGARLSNDDSLQ
jgi:hypothetical protein